VGIVVVGMILPFFLRVYRKRKKEGIGSKAFFSSLCPFFKAFVGRQGGVSSVRGREDGRHFSGSSHLDIWR